MDHYVTIFQVGIINICFHSYINKYCKEWNPISIMDLLFWKSRVATNIARKDIHVTIFQVGIINICLLDILKIVKIQKLENNISIGSIGEEFQ